MSITFDKSPTKFRTRIRILEILVDGSRTVHEVQEALTLEQAAVSQQLAVLRKQGHRQY